MHSSRWQAIAFINVALLIYLVGGNQFTTKWKIGKIFDPNPSPELLFDQAASILCCFMDSEQVGWARFFLKQVVTNHSKTPYYLYEIGKMATAIGFNEEARGEIMYQLATKGHKGLMAPLSSNREEAVEAAEHFHGYTTRDRPLAEFVAATIHDGKLFVHNAYNICLPAPPPDRGPILLFGVAGPLTMEWEIDGGRVADPEPTKLFQEPAAQLYCLNGSKSMGSANFFLTGEVDGTGRLHYRYEIGYFSTTIALGDEVRMDVLKRMMTEANRALMAALNTREEFVNIFRGFATSDEMLANTIAHVTRGSLVEHKEFHILLSPLKTAQSSAGEGESINLQSTLRLTNTWSTPQGCTLISESTVLIFHGPLSTSYTIFYRGKYHSGTKIIFH